jgi:predicted transcriptional regulator of viral defense system
LIETGRLTEFDFPFPSPYKQEVRYAWGKVSLYEVMQTLKSECYFSYYTAVKFHGLTEQLPKTTCLTVEQVNSSISSGEMTQASIDRAFKGKPRTSTNVAESKDFRICIVQGRNTDKLGVVEQAVVPDAGPLRLTNLERTLIDITVRPIYAGGVFEVAKAFELAKEKLSVNALTAMLKKLKYTYPYHQAVGFYLERAGYKSSLTDLLRNIPMKFDFYLTHQKGETDYVKAWRLFVPKGF